jgi:glycosyltransferase involved in cell wall biosynthesis
VLMKIAIVSPVLPPSPSGQAVVLYHLLKNVPPDEYILISPKKYHDSTDDAGKCTLRLTGKYHQIPNFNHRFTNQCIRVTRCKVHNPLAWYLGRRINKFKKIFQNENCSHIVGCSGDPIDPYCAYIASKELDIPYFFYAFDDYCNQWSNELYRRFAATVGPDIIRNAQKVLVTNEFLKIHYSKEYGTDPVVIHNPVDIGSYNKVIATRGIAKEPIKIVYTGAVYEAHLGAFRNLIEAINRINKKIELHVYSDDQCEELIQGSHPICVIIHRHLPISFMPEIQKNADMLFLPLAFKSSYPDIIVKTSSPGKMGEYLAAKRPILVHAPHDSFISWYFTRYECGVVVDSEDIDALAETLIKLIRDTELQMKISTAAGEMAMCHFNLEDAQRAFLNAVTK